MLIGIDGNEANIKDRVGSNIYAYEILWEVYKLVQGNNLKFKIYLKEEPLNDLPKQNDWWQYRVLKPKYWWTQWRLPLELYFGVEKPDLFFTPGHYAPRFAPCPSVISIMDLAFLRFPNQFKKKDLYQLVNWTKYSIEKAEHIFTISEFTKKEIIHFYHYPKEKITVTYPGITQNCNLKLKINKDKYFLYIGTLQPRKNLIRLIEAFERVEKVKGDKNGEKIKLVLAGKKGWLYEEIFQKVKELNLENSVIFTGFVSEKEKLALLKNAIAFILPSLYEGFGIPVLEAIAAGCPVLISRNSSLPEVAGKAAVYIDDPNNVDSIQKGLLKMLELKQSQRTELIKSGYEQVKKFSWKECAKKTLEVLWSLLRIKQEKN